MPICKGIGITSQNVNPVIKRKKRERVRKERWKKKKYLFDNWGPWPIKFVDALKGNISIWRSRLLSIVRSFCKISPFCCGKKVQQTIRLKNIVFLLFKLKFFWIFEKRKCKSADIFWSMSLGFFLINSIKLKD